MALPDAVVRLQDSRLDEESTTQIIRLYFEEQHNKCLENFLICHIQEDGLQSAQLMQV